MKRRIVCAALAALALAAAAAQEQPQIAYRILNGYIEKEKAQDERGLRGVGTGFAVGGGLLLAGAGVTFFAGDCIGEAFFGGPMDQEVRTNVALGLGIGGAAATAVGVGLLAAKPHDWDVEYAEVYAETDAQVREALAVAALKDLAVKGKKARVVGAVSNLAVPVVYALTKALVNVSRGDPWQDEILDGGYWSAFNIASGISSLFGLSDEERLYQKYLAGREALYGAD